MTATSVTVPVMMVFSFLPMLSMFNKTIEKIAEFAYSQQISLWIQKIESSNFELKQPVIIGLNMLVILCIFILAYRKVGLE